jgi:hypothetical protein
MSKDSRIGESLWFIWDGLDYDFSSTESVVFYTEGHIDIEEEVVRKALASSIQREGIASSLSEGFSMIASGSSSQLHSGYSDLLERQIICSENGSSKSGEDLIEVTPITVVEVFDAI